jgi:hypothetical protein
MLLNRELLLLCILFAELKSIEDKIVKICSLDILHVYYFVVR